MKRVIFSILMIWLFSGCNKTEETEWTFCDACTHVDWIGSYQGEGSFYAGYNPEETKEVPVNLAVSVIDDDRWKIKISSEDLFVISFIGDKVDTGCFYDQVGSSKSVHLTLYQKEGKYKISGNAKTYDITEDSLILEKSVSFEVFKKE